MLSIFVCEDDPQQNNAISRYINNCLIGEEWDAQLVLTATTPDEILVYLKNNSAAGLYFLDVDLRNDMNGIELAEKIRSYDPRGFIVFVTVHAAALPNTFKYKVEAMDFIVKEEPGLERRISGCIRDAYMKYTAKNTPLHKTFSFKTTGNYQRYLDMAKILYFKTSDRKHKIQVYSEDSVFEFYGNLRDVKNAVDERFFRCHKSFIINLEHVTGYNKKALAVTLKDEHECSISSMYLSAFIDALEERV